jgi:Cu(I)/Ag(I) efflux system membrane fusion protein
MMSKGIIYALIFVVALATGLFFGSRMSGEVLTAEGGNSTESAEPEVLYWVAPMDPDFRSEKPGKSPMGMDLVPVFASEAGSGDTIKINPAVVNNLGVRTQAAMKRPLWRKVEATGYVGFDETRISHINLRTQGWIVKLLVDAEGERVSKGDLLFELYSPELVNAQKEYLQAHQRNDQRLKRGADEKLQALGMIRSEINQLERSRKALENIKVIAPQDGIIVSLGVREGMYVQPNTAIMSLADLSSVWLQAEVFESQAEWVAQGQAAEAKLDYMPGVVFSGQVEYVYPVLDPVTRTLRVRLRFENPSEQLKPNMYARVSIYGRLVPSALTIPREALIRAPERDRVVVALADGEFKVHEVLTGMESGEWIEIIAGIGEGDQIVTSAQFLLDSEASLAGSIQRLESISPGKDSDSPVSAFGSGWVDSMDIQERKIVVTHGPIDQLGWPGMTMEFDVSEQVDMSALEVGGDIQFALLQQHDGQFIIEKAGLRLSDGNISREQANKSELKDQPEARNHD